MAKVSYTSNINLTQLARNHEDLNGRRKGTDENVYVSRIQRMGVSDLPSFDGPKLYGITRMRTYFPSRVSQWIYQGSSVVEQPEHKVSDGALQPPDVTQRHIQLY